MKREIWIVQRIASLRYAFAGFAFALRTQHNAWIHFSLTIAVCLLAVVLRVSAEDWRWLVVAIVLVWLAELVNTAFEYLCDLVSPGYDERVRRAKDIAAGAVLVCALGAATIGSLVFWPYLWP